MRTRSIIFLLVLTGCADGPVELRDASLDSARVALGARIVPDLNGDGYDDYQLGTEVWLGGADLGGTERTVAAPAVGPDLNGDGLVDLVAASPNDSGTYPASGTVTVTYAAGTPNQVVGPALSPDQANADFGAAWTWGDFNADGIDDIAVAAHDWRIDGVEKGAVFVYMGQAGVGLPSTPSLEILNYSNAVDTERYGDQLATADLNGDGFDDIVFGIRELGSQHSFALVHGSDTGLDLASFERFGVGSGSTGILNLTSEGDIDGDGLDDVVTRIGQVGTVWTGSTGTPSMNRSPLSELNPIRTLPDSDGDGTAELFIETESDWAIVWGGQSGVPAAMTQAPIDINVTMVGDLNGDSYTDYANDSAARPGSATGPRLAAAAEPLYATPRSGPFFYDVDSDGAPDFVATNNTLYLGDGSRVSMPSNVLIYFLGDVDDDGRNEFFLKSNSYYGTDTIADSAGRVGVPDGDLNDYYSGFADSIGDIDGDGLPERAYLGYLYENTGSSWENTSIAVGAVFPNVDYDGDGRLDIVGSKGIWRGGTFPTLTQPDIAWPDNTINFGKAFAGDLNGDGYVDIIDANSDRDYLFPTSRYRAELLLSTGPTTYEHITELYSPLLVSEILDVRDMDRNGTDDVVIAAPANIVTALSLNDDHSGWDIVFSESLSGQPRLFEWTSEAMVLGNLRYVDVDQDGVYDHNDCDSTDPTIASRPWAPDADLDGFGSTLHADVVWHCGTPANFTETADDCNDSDDSVNPGSVESCSSVDSNCDGWWGVDVPGQPLQYRDRDDDGVGLADSTPLQVCYGVDGWVEQGGDCNDARRIVHAGAVDRCDGFDNDCDGLVDIGGFPPEGSTSLRTGYLDRDGDGAFGGERVALCDTDFITVISPIDNDCDDDNASVHVGAPELCDGIDNNCDGDIDIDVEPSIGVLRYLDVDNDGYAGEQTIHVCADAADSFDETPEDCDDSDRNRNPDAREACNGIDDDCDEDIDEGPYVSPYGEGVLAVGFIDLDGDGLAGTTQGGHCLEGDPSQLYEVPTDCDDDDPAILGETEWFRDGDEDGYGDPDDSTFSCFDRSPTYVLNLADCNDALASVNPDAGELCNNRDDDCNGIIDDNPVIGGIANGYPDRDGDGFHGGPLVASCTEVDETLLPTADDCNDSEASVFPGATEVCNGRDDDCNGVADGPEAVDAATWFLDNDDDGYGVVETAFRTCVEPNGHSSSSGDCDDDDATVHPNASETWYDGIDQDCDGNDRDQDGDGVPSPTDCDDTDPLISPLMQEIWYDGIDQDCDGNDDDFDRDGYGIDEDCDDTDGSRNPGATEIWYDTVDQDCDGNDLDQDGDGLLLIEDCDDEDPGNTDTCAPGCSTVPTGPSALWLTPFALLAIIRRRSEGAGTALR